ncbi:hypothetical protein QU521_02715 [Enterobacter roggenkampii]|nr:hypothetical protein [Enterobacter roggenkampii]MBW7680799.1 hypothetical protein [Enterobacter roggenkampii]WJS53514.1 hypothetical protein QU521_02715 [Enterobacter roggenkampii]
MAQTALTQTTAQLDLELSQLKLELDMRQALAYNAALTIPNARQHWRRPKSRLSA